MDPFTGISAAAGAALLAMSAFVFAFRRGLVLRARLELRIVDSRPARPSRPQDSSVASVKLAA